jgi:hypothetical protein
MTVSFVGGGGCVAAAVMDGSWSDRRKIVSDRDGDADSL